MDGTTPEKAFPGIEGLLLDLARVYHWTGLYKPGHPFIEERVKAVHSALMAQVAREPSGRLLLGIARNRVLYRDVFLGGGKELIGAFAEALYVHHVASVAFDADLAPEGMMEFFHGLRALRSGRPGGETVSLPDRPGVKGIGLFAFDYRELLSAESEGTEGPEEAGDPAGREDALWRLLLSADIDDEERERRIAEELGRYPELIPAILKRARLLDPEEGPDAAPEEVPGARSVPGEALARMYRRIAEVVRRLPADRRAGVLAGLCVEDPFLEEAAWEGPGRPGRSLSRALAKEIPDGDFLDLLAAVLAVERKEGKRLRRIFEIIASDRDARGTLAPLAAQRVRDSLRARDRLGLKTWETVERLLLSRSEEAYVGEDHSRHLDELAGVVRAAEGEKGPAARPATDPAIAAAFDEGSVRRAGVHVLLEMLAAETGEKGFLDLVEEFRMIVPNLISRNEVALLKTVLASLAALGGTAPAERRAAIASVAKSADFGGLVDLYIGSASAEERECIAEVVSANGSLAASVVLERLLKQEETPRRKALLKLAFRLGKDAVPAILAALPHPQWYYTRNLCLVLGEIGDRSAVPALLGALRHPDQRVKREAILALGKVRAPEAVGPLGKILLGETFFPSPREDPARIDAASALYRIGGSEALASLHRGKDARRPAVRDHCRALLAHMGER